MGTFAPEMVFLSKQKEAPNLNNGNVLFHFGNFALKAVTVFPEQPDSAFSKIKRLLLLSHNSLQKWSCLCLQSWEYLKVSISLDISE